MALLQTRELSKEFDGVKAMDNLSLEIDKGVITALIGPNDAGKTTAFNVITGFLRADNGDVYFNNTRINSLSPHKISRLGIGRTFQNIRLFSQISVLENVLLGLKYEKGETLWAALTQSQVMKREEEENREEAIQLLTRVGLADKRDELAENLSHGQRKLLEIARALALDPDLLLLDEPSLGLSPNYVELIFEKLVEINRDGASILLVEQNARMALEICHRGYVFEIGSIAIEVERETLIKDVRIKKVFLGI